MNSLFIFLHEEEEQEEAKSRSLLWLDSFNFSCSPLSIHVIHVIA